VLDGLKLEQAGIPAASIVTTPFMGTAQAMAKSWGVKNYQFLVTPHPIANLTQEQLNTQANELATQVIGFFQSAAKILD
jgi:hypothetical protein